VVGSCCKINYTFFSEISNVKLSSIFYGRNDRRVDPRYSIEMIEALGRENAITREFDDHNEKGNWEAHVMACEHAYSDSAHYDWFRDHWV